MYIAGIDPDKRTAAAEFGLMHMGFNSSENGAKGYLYAQADGAIDAGDLVAIKAGQVDVTGINENAVQFGVASAAFADEEYGWVQVWGEGSINAKASAAAYTELYTHATAGHVEDATSTNADSIYGLQLTAARAATDGPAPCQMMFPMCRNA